MVESKLKIYAAQVTDSGIATVAEFIATDIADALKTAAYFRTLACTTRKTDGCGCRFPWSATALSAGLGDVAR